MKKLCHIFTTILGVTLFYTGSSYADVMSADEFKSTVQTLGQQTQDRLKQEVKKNLATKNPADAQAGLANPTPSPAGVHTPPPVNSQPGNAPYTGFGNAPTKPTTPSNNSGSGWNPYQ